MPSSDATEMRAAVFHAPGTPHELRSVSKSIDLQPGERLVRLNAATVCGSDLHTYTGRRPVHGPTVLGHEGCGVVVRTGAGRPSDLVGQRITWSMVDSCGRCAACTDWGLPQKCIALFKYGHSPVAREFKPGGTYATHIVLRKGTRVEPLPDVIPDGVASTANCAGATMVAIIDRIPVGTNRVLVQGAGLLGIYAITLLRERGVRGIVVVEPHENRRRIAERFGATQCLQNHSDVERGGFDAAIELNGSPDSFPDGLGCLRPGGIYLLAGMVHPQSKLDVTGEQIIRQHATIQGIHNYAPSHLAAAVQHLERTQGTHPWSDLISPGFALDDIDKAFELATSGRWHRVLITPNA